MTVPATVGGGAASLVAGALLLVAVIVVYSSIEVVDAYEKRALTVRGEYRGLLEPGINVVPPFVSRTESIDMRSQRATLTVEATTRDGSSVTVEGAVDVAVTDAERLYLETDDYRHDLLSSLESSLASVVGGLDREALLADREDAADRLRAELERRTAGWGIDVEDAEMLEVDATDDDPTA